MRGLIFVAFADAIHSPRLFLVHIFPSHDHISTVLLLHVRHQQLNMVRRKSSKKVTSKAEKGYHLTNEDPSIKGSGTEVH